MSAGRSRLSDVHVIVWVSRWGMCVCALWSSPYALVGESTRRSCLSEVNCCSNPVFSDVWCGMCTAEYAVFWCRPLSLITYCICIAALIWVLWGMRLCCFCSGTEERQHWLLRMHCSNDLANPKFIVVLICRLFIFDGYSPVPSDDRMHVALAYSMFIVLLNRLVYYFHRRLVYSA